LVLFAKLLEAIIVRLSHFPEGNELIETAEKVRPQMYTFSSTHDSLCPINNVKGLCLEIVFNPANPTILTQLLGMGSRKLAHKIRGPFICLHFIENF